MAEPVAFGMVLAMLVDRAGKPAGGGATKGQLYATGDGLVVVRPTRRAEALQRAATALLLGSIAAVVVNLFTWKEPAVIWGAIAAQAVYWVSLPVRRRLLEPEPLDTNGLEAARRAGRVAIRVPASAIRRSIAPEPPRSGFRKPARFELDDGALEIYLSAAQFDEIAAVLARAG
jgi:hypothetical protein